MQHPLLGLKVELRTGNTGQVTPGIGEHNGGELTWVRFHVSFGTRSGITTGRIVRTHLGKLVPFWGRMLQKRGCTLRDKKFKKLDARSKEQCWGPKFYLPRTWKSRRQQLILDTGGAF